MIKKTAKKAKKPQKKGFKHKGKGLLKVAAVKADGKAPVMAKILGISRQAAAKHLEKPEIKNAVEEDRDRLLREAGIVRSKIYSTAAAGMDATKMVTVGMEGMEVIDYKERRESAKLCAQLLNDLKPDGEGAAQMPFIVFLPPTKEVIDVDAKRV